MAAEPPDRPALALAGAILIGSVLIAASIALTFRYEMAPVPPRAAALRLDRWSGEIRWCEPESEVAAFVLKCTAK